MEYVYAALLLHAAGKEITEENLKAVLEAAGVSPDEARIKALVAALEGVNIDEVIEKAAMPVAAPVAVAAAPAAEGGAAEAAQEEEEEEEEEVSEEEALAGLGALFG
ncbi:50S ribosomal protein P1 [Thermococcus peptonophilus]|uniref:Large ribosomal subunit protein P1 n=1 Tax=Thermococcus peptonophilus TaxID=53952 RepID=A0A142CWH1_9EURY|nr:50S ribosomal protein P1 [Thermococcus peptonophilus]AMQ19123.1 50S ribosomal protein P1 [Thermococcus peptonophilus]